MKKITSYCLLCTCFILSISCKKEKECERVSIVTACISETFPDSSFNLNMVALDSSMINFTTGFITFDEGELQDDESDECYIHESQTTELRHNLDNYSILFSYPFQSFGRSFYIYFNDNLNLTQSRFRVGLVDGCVLSELSVSEDRGEAFYNEITINDQVYQNVFKISNDNLYDGINDNDNGKFQFLYFSVEEGILKLESSDDIWEKAN